MKKQSSTITVRYVETDQMGFVHHGNYAQYLELARIDWLKQYGVSYKSLEEEGVMLPVFELKINYKKPAFFDDKLVIETSLVDKPSVKIKFHYLIKNKKDEIITTAETVLVFVDAQTRRPIRCPNKILKALKLD